MAPDVPFRNSRVAGDQGFSVVELLAVMAVILVIASILIPLLLREVQRTQATLIVEEWHLLSEAVVRYEVDVGEALGGWLTRPGMPPGIRTYVAGDLIWENPDLGLRKSFIRLPARHPNLDWQTVFLITVDRPSHLIDVIHEVHDGRQTAYIPGRAIGLVID